MTEHARCAVTIAGARSTVPRMGAALFHENLALARACAHKMRSRHESFDDVHADALIGLWQASEKYDPQRGASFGTFAWPRISGAINDGRRERDFLSRSQRKAGTVETPVSMEAVLTESGMTLADVLADPTSEDDPFADDEARWGRHVWLMRLIGDLPDDDRYVVTRRLDGLNLAEIGDEMGVTESRVCQLHDRAVGRLRQLARGDAAAA